VTRLQQPPWRRYRGGYRSDRSLTGVRRHGGHIATGPAGVGDWSLRKSWPARGDSGRVGFSTGVDEAPVLDADPQQKRFRAKW